MNKPTKDIGASVRARLLRLAQERGDDFQLVLTRYANERLLYRLTHSRHAPRFVLKGATLFTLWTGEPHRATRDVDLLGFGEPSADIVRNVFAELLAAAVDDDGVHFDIDSLNVGPIREEQEYGGVRLLVVAHISSAKLKLQIDVGFGDAITPDATTVTFPALLDYPAPRLKAYPRETVIAEKLEAMVTLGLANTRMKDFYDLALLSNMFDFEGDVLVRAITATFTRRKTPLPSSLPVALLPEFTSDRAKATQWAAFLRKSAAPNQSQLPETVATIARFASEPLSCAASGISLSKVWKPGGPWTSPEANRT